MSNLTSLALTGRTREHVQQWLLPRFAAIPEVVSAFLAMREAALKAGFELLPFSSFRDFDTQCRIWNMKFLGQKNLYDQHGNVRDYNQLTEQQRLECILNWSAIPGGSRHHWGTEIDVVDAASMPAGYKVKLLPEEVQVGGIFYELHQWLDEHISEFGFFRPYARYQGGMYCEPWHLSYAPLSMPALENLTIDMLMEALTTVELAGQAILLDNLPTIYQNHIKNICLPNSQEENNETMAVCAGDNAVKWL